MPNNSNISFLFAGLRYRINCGWRNSSLQSRLNKCHYSWRKSNSNSNCHRRTRLNNFHHKFLRMLRCNSGKSMHGFNLRFPTFDFGHPSNCSCRFCVYVHFGCCWSSCERIWKSFCWRKEEWRHGNSYRWWNSKRPSMLWYNWSINVGQTNSP